MRLEIVQLTREDCLDDAGINRFGPDLEPSLEGTDEILTDLQWRLELGCVQCCCIVGDDVVGRDALVERGLKDSVDVVALSVPQASELKHRRAITNLFHLRTAQVVLGLRVSDQHD